MIKKNVTTKCRSLNFANLSRLSEVLKFLLVYLKSERLVHVQSHVHCTITCFTLNIWEKYSVFAMERIDIKTRIWKWRIVDQGL